MLDLCEHTNEAACHRPGSRSLRHRICVHYLRIELISRKLVALFAIVNVPASRTSRPAASIAENAVRARALPRLIRFTPMEAS
jgi:hypothetical protein